MKKKNLRSVLLVVMMAAILAISVTGVFAAETTVKGTMSPIIWTIVDIMENIALYVGIVLLVWGVVMLILAFKNEDADSKSKAIMLIVVAVALISIGTVLQPVLDTLTSQGHINAKA